MKTDISYSPSAVFDTFPMPGSLVVSERPAVDGLREGDVAPKGSIAAIANRMAELDQWRADILRHTKGGITELYGAVHDPSENSPELTDLRDRHVELDGLVSDAYGWGDLTLGHDFQETRNGLFFTVSTEARFELLMRLLELNFAQFAMQSNRSLDSVSREAQRYG